MKQKVPLFSFHAYSQGCSFDSGSRQSSRDPTIKSENLELDLRRTDDFVEAMNEKRRQLLKQTEKLTSGLEPRYTSSFIQNILYEDSHVGVAVVDLFVAVKRAKDKLNLLTKINNEASKKMTALKREAGERKMDYSQLVGNVNDFFDRMSDSAKLWVMNAAASAHQSPDVFSSKLSGKENVTSKFVNSEEEMNVLNKLKFNCQQAGLRTGRSANEGKESEREVKWIPAGISGCSICQKNAAQDTDGGHHKPTGQVLNMNPEEVISALIVAMLKNKHGDAVPDVIQTQYGVLKLSDINAQVMCDICEILNFVPPDDNKEEEVKLEKKSSTKSLKCSLTWSKDFAYLKDLSPKASDRDDNASEGDSIFEEALSEPAVEVKTRPSVTCMGDLTKTGSNKSISMRASKVSAEASWISKVTEEIKSKLRNLKPTTQGSGASDPEDPAKTATQVPGVGFTISANTPIGLFDVTVKQYKHSRQITEEERDYSYNSEVYLPPKTLKKPVSETENYWSDDSFQSSDSDHMFQVDSMAGEEEMEEFVEIFVQNKTESKRKNPVVSLDKGTTLKTTLKQGSPPIFQIQKCQPKYFVQEILPKEVKGDFGLKEEKVQESNRGEVSSGMGVIVNDREDDLVIYIQVEVDEEEDEDEDDSRKIYIECKSSIDDIPILLNNKKKKFTVEERIKNEKVERMTPDQEEGTPEGSEDVIPSKEPQKKSVTFYEDFSDLPQERQISETLPEDSEAEMDGEEPAGAEAKPATPAWETAIAVRFLYDAAKADVCHVPYRLEFIQRVDVREELPCPAKLVLERDAPELLTALQLIHEIENNVVGVKLSDAILILPNLESELRKHLQQKMKRLTQKELSLEASMQDFFSAVDFLPENQYDDGQESENSEERLVNLFSLLSSLEDAVKTNETSSERIDLCDDNSSRIFKLLQALTQSIKNLENGANMTNLAETLNIASQLDTAVREYESIAKRTVEDPDQEKKAHEDSSSWKDISVKEHMRNVRRKVFQTVEDEATKTEDRIELDFDRIDRLERENEEAMNFVEALLQKLARRTSELDFVKKELKDLSSSMEKLYLQAVKRKEEKKNRDKKPDLTGNERQSRSEQTVKQDFVRNTVSGLLLALHNLKLKAREKNEACREILKTASLDTLLKFAALEKKASRCSRSSFTAKTADDLLCMLKDFRRIGESSLYMAWSKPEGPLADFVIGYEILVNGKLNQKVRNPQRTQAVLYSVDLKRKAEIQLFGLVENGTKIMLATVTHYDT